MPVFDNGEIKIGEPVMSIKTIDTNFLANREPFFEASSRRNKDNCS